MLFHWGLPPCNVYPVKSDRYFTGACPACPVAPEDGTGVGSGNRTGVNSSSACLLAKSDRIGGDRLNLVNQDQVNPLGLEVHRGSGGFALLNACPVKSLSRLPGEMQIRFHWGGILSFDCGEAYRLLMTKSQEQI